MFESEIGFSAFASSELPAVVLSQFRETARLVHRRSQISWAEHCSECAAPACFSTCEFYDPRPDLKCRRFRGGFHAQTYDALAVDSVLRVTFRRWGKLEGAGHTTLLPTADAIARERRDVRLGKLISDGPAPFGLKVYLARARQRGKAEPPLADGTAHLPNAFLVEAYNGAPEPVSATLSVRARDAGRPGCYQHLLEFRSGYNRVVVPYAPIAAHLDLSRPFLVQIEPHETASETTLYFGLIDFVHIDDAALPAPERTLPAAALAAKRKIKCVVWDLDNTMWDGTLIEDGPDAIRIREDVVRIVRELDRRGVLNSVASKNNPRDALALLDRFGIAEYFLCPQVSWGPKSGAVGEIARRLNIGVDSLAFVDDQPFELAEVRAAHPDVAVIEAAALAGLLDDPRFDVPETAESRQRRAMYRVEMEREAALETVGGDYLGFLRTCGLELTIAALTPDAVDRVHELAQRTNQMNFSGNRYTVASVEDMLVDERIEAFVLSARDRFGDYGIIGFAVVDREQGILRDLMFSCRIQGKHVDRALLAFLVERYAGLGHDRFVALYRESERNRPAAQLFWDMGFAEAGRDANLHTLVYDTRRKGIPPQDVVKVIVEEKPCVPAIA